jgi:flagellum-specific peptidoglycan hydrolase FlgJ
LFPIVEDAMNVQEEFLTKASAAARAGGHLFPEYAACEAALESAWGMSRLATDANNLFGEKQSHPPIGDSLDLPTKEYLHGAWVWVPAVWAKFADWQSCFAARMALLERLAKAYPAYEAALGAKDGESFVKLVSKRWSTDPERGAKVLEVWAAHQGVLAAAAIEV